MANTVSAQRRRTVLVVEDNDMNRELLCELLADGMRLKTVAEGVETAEQVAAATTAQSA